MVQIPCAASVWDHNQGMKTVKRYGSTAITRSGRVVAWLAVSVFFVLTPASVAGDLDDLEDRIAREIEEDIAEHAEEALEEEIADHAEDDVLEDIAEDIEDALEDQLKLEERLQRDIEDDLEDALEDALKLEEDLADDLADEIEEAEVRLAEELEDAARALEDAEKKLADDLERAERDRLRELDDLEDQARRLARQHERELEDARKSAEDEAKDLRKTQAREMVGLDDFLNENDEPAIPGEVLILVEAEQVSRLTDLGVVIAEAQGLESLGLVLLTLRAPNDEALAEVLSRLPDDLDQTLFDYNHLYTLDSEAPRIREIAPPMNGATPLELASHLGFKTSSHADLSVGLIDTAVDASHPCLKTASIEQASFVPDYTMEVTEHGTSVASILLADTSCGLSGLVEGAQLYSASVFYQAERGGQVASVSGLVRAIDWLIRKDVSVINLSLSGPANELLHRAVREAAERGILVVAAVGNAGPAAPPRYPAAYPEAIGITAADSDNIIYRRAGRGRHVAFTAPGVDVAVAVPGGFAVRSGTSIATPFASALLLEAVGTTSGPGLLQRFQKSTLDLGAPGFDEVYGYGLVQMPKVQQAHSGQGSR